MPPFEKIERHDLDLAEMHNCIASALYEAKMYHEAASHCKEALALRPRHAGANHNLGKILFALGLNNEATVQFEVAISIDPLRVETYNNLGVLYQTSGLFKEAEQAFRTGLKISPTNVTIHFNLANLRPFHLDDIRLSELQSIYHNTLVSQDEKVVLDFALGKAYSDLGQHERSFNHLNEGATLKRRLIHYNEKATLDLFSNTKAAFHADLMSSMKNSGNTSSLPIFVVGMPRSGTTLVEQIIASHSNVFGGGELEIFPKLANNVSIYGKNSLFPDMVASMSSTNLFELGVRYLNEVRAMSPSASRIVDKMPINVLYLGLISLSLPGARIIQLHRDPIDICFSCFSSLFSDNRQAFSYDLNEIGRYYRAYDDLVQHWSKVIPRDAVLNVRYEQLVDDFEAQARAIIEHCGLQWEKACLDFFLTQRTVRTASMVQVRQPIFRTSVGRSRPYRKFLKPLITTLQIEDRLK